MSSVLCSCAVPLAISGHAGEATLGSLLLPPSVWCVAIDSVLQPYYLKRVQKRVKDAPDRVGGGGHGRMFGKIWKRGEGVWVQMERQLGQRMGWLVSIAHVSICAAWSKPRD